MTKTKKKGKQLTLASITGVHPPHTHGFGVWDNPRELWTFRCDSKLKKAGKRVLRQVFGSDCRGFEAFLAGLVATYEAGNISGVYPSNTVEIGKLVIERNLRPRRRLTMEKEVTKMTVEEILCRRCSAPATKRLMKGKKDVADLCGDCFKMASYGDYALPDFDYAEDIPCLTSDVGKCEWFDCPKIAVNEVYLRQPRGQRARKEDLTVRYCENHTKLCGDKIGFRPLQEVTT